MRSILHVARHVFRDSVRDKVLYSIVAFAVILMVSSFLIGQLTAGQDVKIIKDLGLAAMSLFGLFIAIFIGVGLVSREIERRSIYAVLAKPVRRHEFVIGKYFGLVGTLLANLAVMAIAYYLVLEYMRFTMPPGQFTVSPAVVDPRLSIGIGMIAAELAVVTAVAVFWSTFSSSAMLSAALTAGIWVAGQFGADLRNFDQVVKSPAAAALARGLYYLLPNFAAFDVKSQVVHGLPVGADYIVVTLLYGAAYVAMLLTAAVFIFSRRDFK
jgi:ABC-type transport system involved in multi-copper enzyme maturation permease subunit